MIHSSVALFHTNIYRGTRLQHTCKHQYYPLSRAKKYSATLKEPGRILVIRVAESHEGSRNVANRLLASTHGYRSYWLHVMARGTLCKRKHGAVPTLVGTR